jgi:hypothetical protein
VTIRRRLKYPLLTSISPNPSGEPTIEPTTMKIGNISVSANVEPNDRRGVDKKEQANNPQIPQA